MEGKTKHLEMIQSVINRMSSNSFLLKGWTVTLVAGIFALSSKETSWKLFFVAYVPLVIFWWLDSYYLQFERKYRNLYDKARVNSIDNVDFSMKITEELLTQDTAYCKCLFSKIEILFYLSNALVVTGIIYLILH